jgi:hypothetical protein
VAVFQDVAPCSLVESKRRFRGAYCRENRETEKKTDLHNLHSESLKSHITADYLWQHMHFDNVGNISEIIKSFMLLLMFV